MSFTVIRLLALAGNASSRPAFPIRSDPNTKPTAHSAFDLRHARKGVAPPLIEAVLNRSCHMPASRRAEHRKLERES